MKGKLNVEKLVAKYLLGDITAPERKQLEDWTKSSPERKEFFNRLCTNIAFRERYEAYSHINSHVAWERFKKKYCPSIISTYLKYAAIFSIFAPFAINLFDNTVLEGYFMLLRLC